MTSGAPPKFEVISGDGVMVDVLTDMLERAKAGQFVGVLVLTIQDGAFGWIGAKRDDMALPWPRFLGAIEAAKFALMHDGIDGLG